jgi:simple sugar transport system ATP-binding protein
LPEPATGVAQPVSSLRLENISKRFGTLQALANVSFRLRPGSVHALLGENGAGKTTLMRIAFGMIEPDAGRILLGNAPVKFRSPADAIRAGIGMVHQHFMLIPAMTVAENVELGAGGRFDAARAADRVRAVGKKTGLHLDPNSRVVLLNVASQQRVEIIKALSRDARILILDEPTAVLAPVEARELLSTIRALAEDGRSVVLITHKLRDALQYSDEVSILRRGELVLSGHTSDLTQKTLARAMIGESSSPIATWLPRSSETDASPVINLSDVTVEQRLAAHALKDINLEVRQGEIVGIAALDGAAADLLRVIARRDTAKSGTVTAPSKIGFIPEDRHREAIIPEFQLFENVALRDSGTRRGRMPWTQLRSSTASLLNRFDIRAQSVETLAGELSGGNQQKLVLARELDENPHALIAENPTRGLDVHAAENVKGYLREAAGNGCAILFYSSDIDELVEIADRIVVVREGQLTEVQKSIDAIGGALLGASLERTAEHKSK